MLLGDAAGLASPISGEGIYYAIRSGAIAAQVAKETVEMKRISHVNSYEHRIREEIGREREIQKFIAKTLFESNDTVERILRLLSKDEVLQRYAKQIILGNQNKNIKQKIIRRILTKHPLKGLRFAI